MATRFAGKLHVLSGAHGHAPKRTELHAQLAVIGRELAVAVAARPFEQSSTDSPARRTTEPANLSTPSTTEPGRTAPGHKDFYFLAQRIPPLRSRVPGLAA